MPLLSRGTSRVAPRGTPRCAHSSTPGPWPRGAAGISHPNAGVARIDRPHAIVGIEDLDAPLADLEVFQLDDDGRIRFPRGQRCHLTPGVSFLNPHIEDATLRPL